MARRSLPSRLLPRALATGRLAGHLGKAAARRLVRASRDDAEALGDAMVAELDGMKGLAMKVGQILSYMDVGLPDATVARLAALQRGADPLAFSVVAARIEAELGRPVAEAFARLDPVPVAAASIGQVHRGRVDGREVAVKVRYPGVRETLDGDLSRLRPIARLAGLGAAVDGEALLRSLRDRMLAECDYRQEAAWQRRFQGVAARLADVVVPEVVDTHSSEGVLTTQWIDAPPLTAAHALPTPRREQLAASLVGLLFTSIEQGLLHGAPHPGNVLVTDDGLALLDFGAVVEVDGTVAAALRELIGALRRGDDQGVQRVLVRQGLAPRPERIDWAHMHRFWRWLLGPALPGARRYDPAHMASARHFAQPGDPNLRHQGLPPTWLWLLRALWGLNAVLCRLQVCVDTSSRVPG